MTGEAIRLGTLSLVPFRELMLGGRPLPVGGKALQLLSVLAQAEGALVTKDELMAAVWPDVIIEENAIQVHIAALRKALGAEAGRLSTARGLGYRLTTNSAAYPLTANGAAADNRPIVAVLPFDELSGDPEMRHFADGVSEEILLSVRRIDGLRVVARASSFQFRGDDKKPARIASELNASHVLDGSARRAGDSIRVSVELSETVDETVLWSNGFDRPLSDFLALQDEIAAAVAHALKETFIAPPPPPRIDPAALELYLKGRALENIRETRQECIALFEAALAIDSNLVGAWTALAITLGISLRWDPDPGDSAELIARIKEAAAKALSLDPKAGAAHVALGFVEPYASYGAFEAHLERALAAAPHDPQTLTQCALLYYSVGRLHRAFQFATRAYQLDPLNIITYQTYADLLWVVGDRAASLDLFKRAEQRWSGHWWLLGAPWARAAFVGDWELADGIEAVIDKTVPGIELIVTAVAILRDPNDTARALVVAQFEAQLAERGWLDYSSLVFAHGLGLEDQTYEWIARSGYAHLRRLDSRAPDDHGFMSGMIFTDIAAPMRRDPRFLTWCTKLGLCDYWLETGRWPDCADDPDIPYDFRAEARRAAIKPKATNPARAA